ncbi:Hypothetical predicted protein, partial [Paramuricea clavata]
MNDHKVDYPSFSEFVSFIELVSREKNDPNLCLNALEGDRPGERNRDRPGQSYKTAIPDAGQGTKSPPTPVVALHGGRPPALGKPNESKENTLIGNIGTPPKPEEVKGHGEETAKVNTKCIDVCGQQSGGKSCAKICLAHVFVHGQTETKIRAYVVIDDQSNCSLGKSVLFDQLNLRGEPFTYTLQTCAGQSE